MSVATNVNFNLVYVFLFKQTSCWLFTFIAITYLFRLLVDGNCLYSAVSVKQVGSNSLICFLRILTSIALFLNCEHYSRHPVLVDAYDNGKILLGKKLFT